MSAVKHTSKKRVNVAKVYVVVATTLFSIWLCVTTLNLAATAINIMSNGAVKLYKVAVHSVPVVKLAAK